MGTVTTRDGVEIFFKDWGPRDAQPIAFHHGWPLSADDGDTQMLFFLEKGFRVVAHDRRGHGRSSQVGEGHDPLSAKLLRNAKTKFSPGFPHGMPTTQADRINADLLELIRG
jgi:pimeloyl-ACP methyl ester carboxylesterase